MELYNYDVDTEEFINKHVLAPRWPFRFLICGPSGSGKTNVLLNLIFHYLHYNKIYIYAKDLFESKYQLLQDFFEEVHEKIKERFKEPVEVAYFSSEKEHIIKVDDLDPQVQNLIIFDDFVMEKDQHRIKDLFIRSRKKNTSIIYLTQSYFTTPKDIRLQCNDIPNNRERSLIQNEHAIKKDEFHSLFRNLKPYHFILVDKSLNQLRVNFNPIK